MPYKKIALAQSRLLPRLRRAFWIGAGALVALALTFALLSWLNHRGLELVLESQLTGRVAREARSLALDRETAIRGYLLSRQQVSLVPEIAARAPLKAKLDSLVMLSRGNASQQDRARSVRSAVDRWERGWASIVLDPANSKVAFSAREALAGKELFDSIRSAFSSFLAGEQRIFSVRVRMLTFLQRFGFGLIILEIGILLAILFWLRTRSLTQTLQLIQQNEVLENQTMDLQHQATELEEQAVELEEQTDQANRAVSELSETNAALENTIRRLEAAESTATLAQASRQETQLLLDVVLNNSPVGVALFDDERKLVRVNAAIESITGVPAESHVGRRADEIMSDDIADTIDGFLDHVLTTSESVTNLPLAGSSRAAPTKERHFLSSFFPVVLPGRRNGIGAVILETTQYRQLEEQLLQAQKMEAVGRLAGGVAHDFNNMLTAIMSYSELILADIPANSPQRADLDEIVKAADKAKALTRKLLAFSRQQVLRPARVDLNSTIESLRNMMRRILGKEVQLTLQLGDELWPVTADPIELERVIMNLVINSRDAMPKGGKLIVETSNVTIDEEYASTHADTSAGEYVQITVTDTGSGMTREVREKLFEPFFTTKEKGKGTGLGLPSAYGIVKQSGGFIWVYSEPGQGTTFKVYLPRAEEGESVRASTPSKNRRVGTETILLVEDDAEVRQVATRILRRNGYQVLEAENGAEALKLCESQEEPVDLIVTDIVMPEMGGSELAKKIREKQPDARILFTSGYTEDTALRQQFLQPGEAFIEKPFTPALLAQKARDLLSPVVPESVE